MKLGIVGCGLIGTKRAAAAVKSNIAVSLVTDRSPERAKALAQSCNAEATVDWQTIITSDVDAVVVATSHDSLADISLGVVQAGKHLLVEKPAGRKASEVKPVLEVAQQKGLVAKCGFNHRFHPALMKAKEILETGVLGDLMFIRGRYGHGGRVGYEEEWRCQQEVSGGGELIDQGSHLIDLSRWFMGELSLDYGLASTHFWNIDVDDNCFMSLRGKSGEVAWLHASWSEWKNMFSYEIYGRHGKLAVDGLGGSYGVERLTYYKMLPEMGPPETTSWEFPFPDLSWQREFDNFAGAIAGTVEPVGTIADAVANLELVDQIYQGRNQ